MLNDYYETLGKMLQWSMARWALGNDSWIAPYNGYYISRKFVSLDDFELEYRYDVIEHKPYSFIYTNIGNSFSSLTKALEYIDERLLRDNSQNVKMA